MIALEAWLLVLAAGVSEARPETPAEAPPPVELLEFVGDWSGEEGRLIDDAAPAEPAAASGNRGNEGDDAEQETDTGS